MKCRETPTEGKSCETLVGFSMYGSPMETVEHMWVYISDLSQNCRNAFP